MRLVLTVADPDHGVGTDVLIEADAETPVHAVGRALGERLRGPAHGTEIFVDRRAVDGRLGLRESPLVDGAVVGLGSAAGCPAGGEPVGLVEVRVVGGPGAGVVHRLGPGEFLVGAGPDCAVALDDPTVADASLVLVVGADGSCAVLPAGVGDGFDEVLLDGEPVPAAGRMLPLPLVTDGDARAGVRPLDDLQQSDGDVGGRIARADGGDLEAAAFRPAPVLAVGAVLLTVAVAAPPDLATRPTPDGHRLHVNRPPRLPARRTADRLRLPSAPVRPERRPPPIVATLLPVAGAGVMALVLHTYYLLMLAPLASLGLIATHLSGRRHARREYRRDLAAYRRRLHGVRDEIRSALARECAARRLGAPDPALVLLTAVGPRRRLWERRRGDPDHLCLRVGTADLPSELTVEGAPGGGQHDEGPPGAYAVPDVPVTVALTECGVVGVAGRGGLPRVVGCWLLAQAVVLHGPLDLTVFVLTDEAGARTWDWARWLPHVRPPDGTADAGDDAAAQFARDETTRARRIAELAALVAERAADRGGRPIAPTARADTAARAARADTARGRPGPSAGPDVLVILDGARAMRGEPGMVPVLRDGPAVGVYTICLDRDVRLLPRECQAVVEQIPGGLRISQAGAATVDGVRPDLVATAATLHPAAATPDDTVTPEGAAAWCERVARALAPLRDVGGGRAEVTMPTAARLLDILGLDPPTAAGVAARWAAAPDGDTACTIGLGPGGPCALDLRRDGPHGLIAGTTGAGKSELLQSIVASLAVANRPDALTFVLVDYKGGAAFAECVDLPHCVGLVTDLDGHLVGRALASLDAELRRREHLLAAAGAKDLEDYQQVTRASRPGISMSTGTGAGRDPARSSPPAPPRLTPLPRLVIVIDEFASLARELPEFVAGLVNIAQRGRSLGIHLLLATQRPAGVVSAEIRANTNLRIGLRMTDAGESADVLEAPDAARISRSTPGRAYARTGHASLLAFQTGRVGGRWTPPARARGGGRAMRAPWVAELPRAALGRALPRPPTDAAEDDGGISDLRMLVAAVRAAADRAAVPRQAGPWLPPLPSLITADDLLGSVPAVPPRPGAQGGHRRLPPVPIGLSDLPGEQAQRAYRVDLERDTHLLVVGSARSGRSTVLRTFAGVLAATIPSCDAHLFGVDCGNNALRALTALPHTGAVVGADAPARVERLLDRLRAEVGARQEVFAAAGYADLGEQRAAEPAAALPYLVLLLDRFEGFLAAFENLDGGRLVDELTRLLREGPAVGLRVLVTGDRRALTGRIASAIERRLVLRLADRGDYPLAGLASAAVPDVLPPGRGFRLGIGADDEAACDETQIALLDPDPSGRAQVAALARLGASAAARDGVPPGPATGPRTDPLRPMRIDELPVRITLAEATAFAGSPTPAPLRGLVGVGGDELRPLVVDLADDGPGFTVAGPPRSGRSSTLLCLAATLLAGGTRLVLITPRPSSLRLLAGVPGVLGPLGAGDSLAGLPLGAGREDGAPTVVLVDDAELLTDTPLAAELADHLHRARDAGSALVAAATTEDLLGQFRGFLVDLRRSGCGLLLWPAGPADGELFGRRLARTAAGGARPPGRGWYFRRELPVPIQTQVPVVPAGIRIGGCHPHMTGTHRSPTLAQRLAHDPRPAVGVRSPPSTFRPRDGEGAAP
jgi:S-DNA-T family DNA segregation ATPase FtsK/SpoIIIE